MSYWIRDVGETKMTRLVRISIDNAYNLNLMNIINLLNWWFDVIMGYPEILENKVK